MNRVLSIEDVGGWENNLHGTKNTYKLGKWVFYVLGCASYAFFESTLKNYCHYAHCDRDTKESDVNMNEDS